MTGMSYECVFYDEVVYMEYPRKETPDDISHEKRQDRIVCYSEDGDIYRPYIECKGFKGIGR